jgi:acetyl esterase/lipase
MGLIQSFLKFNFLKEVLMIRFLLATIISMCVFMPPAFAKTEAGKSDLAREKRMAAEVEDAVLDGEVIFLKDMVNDGHKFMAIDQEPEGDTKGAVIILHGRGFHPNWEDTVFPLRTELPAKGWRTLSLQMPVLQKSAKYFDYVPLFPQAGPRIEEGIKYLQEQGIKNIVLLAHSCGGHMAMEWIRSQGGKVNNKISAYIGAGMGATDFGQKMAKPFPYDKLTVPVLDVFGSKEYPAVLAKASSRLMAITKAGNVKSKQVIVPGANHYFTDKGDELVEPVIKWLDSL